MNAHRGLTILQDLNTIPLSRGLNTLVDYEDWVELSQLRWHAWKSRYESFYGQRYLPKENGVQKAQWLHRAILSRKLGDELTSLVDHKNGDSLDNRRTNLRPASGTGNQANRRKSENCLSNFKGVTWSKEKTKWMAQCGSRGTKRFLGYFADEIEAARAYDFAARERFGEFAKTNYREPTT
jgi:hypothetical protein